MSKHLGQIGRLFLILLAAVIGAVFGLVVGLTPAFQSPGGEKVENWPMPHHIPKYPGGVTLRYAMVHDVIHERFPKHGKAYYEERNRRVEQALEKEKAKRGTDGKPTPEYFALIDDLAVGLDQLGKHEEAVEMMKKKFEEQKSLGMKGRDLYSTYANHGTFLILWQLSEGFDDKAKAKERIQESVTLVHKAVEVYPQSHFGREVWQAVIEEYLLALLDNPDLVLKYDMIGDRLNPAQDLEALRGRRNGGSWGHYEHRQAANFLRDRPDAPGGEEERQSLRTHITKVGAEPGWNEAAKTSNKEPVPFDEPALGIVGMWRYGGGANPHFALALAEIMMRVGQRYIAWCAYERAGQMAQFVGPEPIAKQFAAHCRQWQERIERDLLEDPAINGAEEVAKLRPRFNEELQHGRDYQKAYQEYEAAQIKAGASIDDPHFYDAFEKKHGSIASPVGEADVYQTTRPHDHEISWGAILLFSGGFAFVAAVLLHLTIPTAKRDMVR
jgi:hypothetical protein